MFDELSLVRAIGKREPDNTDTMAKDWCEQNGKSFLFSEYKNEAVAANWEHVDSFAAARNASFKQATGDWLFWADCDDQVRNSEVFREQLMKAPEDVVMVRYFYDVQGSGKKLFRERAVRGSAFRNGRIWHHSVHENLLLMPLDHHADWSNGPVWIHAPNSVKKENRKRNLRILANSVTEVASQYFYIHQEHYCAQNKLAAQQFGKIALSLPGLQPAFRYEILLNLAKIADNHRDALAYVLEAHSIYPWCREAVAALVLLMFEKNESRKAAWWSEYMTELKEPLEVERPWTHEAKWYGWAGLDLMARAHRLDGKEDKAEQAQSSYYLGAKPKIALLHATRGRASKAVGCRDHWLGLAKNPHEIEHIFAVDLDDKESVQMSKQFLSVVSDKKTCVAAWNLAAKKATADLLIQLSDDWTPPLHWDEKLLALVSGKDLEKEEIVIAVNDGKRTDSLLCMAILSRGRLEQQGDLFYEGYESVFSDNEFSVRAFQDGIVIDARDQLTFEHLHPLFGKGEMDATYQHSNSRARYASGEKLYNERNPQ